LSRVALADACRAARIVASALESAEWAIIGRLDVVTLKRAELTAGARIEMPS
jgi:hypothetical protein